MPAHDLSSGDIASRSCPQNSMLPLVTVYKGLPVRTEDNVLFPAPLGPITAWISPFFMVRSMPFNISLSPTDACRSLISNNMSLFISSIFVANIVKAEGRRKFFFFFRGASYISRRQAGNIVKAEGKGKSRFPFPRRLSCCFIGTLSQTLTLRAAFASSTYLQGRKDEDHQLVLCRDA